MWCAAARDISGGQLRGAICLFGVDMVLAACGEKARNDAVFKEGGGEG